MEGGGRREQEEIEEEEACMHNLSVNITYIRNTDYILLTNMVYCGCYYLIKQSKYI